jgi:excinuclease ABC subunit C
MNPDFDLQEELKKLPQKPGVYIMHGRKDEILYVGKAVNLNRRVHQYFVHKLGRGPKIEHMVSRIAYFEYIVTDSELEALVLENNLIKENRPKYNTLLKDDKTYPYIKVTVQEAYPRVLFTRKMKKDGARYFGPFKSSFAVKETIELLRKLYSVRDCTRNLPRDIGLERPCLNYQIGQCDAPCQGRVTSEEYQEKIGKAIDFLEGNYRPVVKQLEERMKAASEEMDFETAAKMRDLMQNVISVTQKQKMENGDGEDRDVLALAIDGTDAVVQVFYVRGGKLIGRDHSFLRIGEEDAALLAESAENSSLSQENDGEGVVRGRVLSTFVRQFYASSAFLPKEILLSDSIEDQKLIAEWLSARRGNRVYLKVPQRGTHSHLVQMALENAQIALKMDRERVRMEEGRTIGAMQEIASILGLGHLSRVEAYDISNTSGVESVGSMIVFEKGKPKRTDYRKFRIRTVEGPNDYASLREVITRRLTHGQEEAKELAQRNLDVSDGSFSVFPDLIMMDGGRGQVNIAEQVCREIGVDIPVCGMVKDDYHRTRGLYYHNVELPIDTRSEGFKLITRIQDEAHRFAIEYHRSLRAKAQTRSLLDEIEGIGPARRKALLRAFGSLEAIRDADEEHLAHAPSMNAASARKVYEFFHPASTK